QGKIRADEHDDQRQDRQNLEPTEQVYIPRRHENPAPPAWPATGSFGNLLRDGGGRHRCRVTTALLQKCKPFSPKRRAYPRRTNKSGSMPRSSRRLRKVLRLIPSKCAARS